MGWALGVIQLIRRWSQAKKNRINSVEPGRAKPEAQGPAPETTGVLVEPRGLCKDLWGFIQGVFMGGQRKEQGPD